MLLIDERPESGNASLGQGDAIVRSTSPHRFTSIAEMVIEKGISCEHRTTCDPARPITRLARAYNLARARDVASGGVVALYPPNVFGAARNIEGGGSLTIVATCLIDTGSRMDDVIYEEFKGTGNMEIHLDRRMYEKRIFPAINVNRSGTRREELLIEKDVLQKIWVLRKLLYPMDELEATEFLLDKVKATKNNADFFDSMRRG